MRRIRNIACAQKEHEVSRANSRKNRAAQSIQVLIVFNRLAILSNFVGETLAADARNWCFACSINIRQPKSVRSLEAAAKLPQQVLSARIAMRLESNQKPPGIEIPKRRDCGLDFRWMMSVIIEDPETVITIKFLLPSSRAFKIPNCPIDLRWAITHLVQHGDHASRIQNVFFAKQ